MALVYTQLISKLTFLDSVTGYVDVRKIVEPHSDRVVNINDFRSTLKTNLGLEPSNHYF